MYVYLVWIIIQLAAGNLKTHHDDANGGIRANQIPILDIISEEFLKRITAHKKKKIKYMLDSPSFRKISPNFISLKKIRYQVTILFCYILAPEKATFTLKKPVQGRILQIRNLLSTEPNLMPFGGTTNETK